MSKCGELHAEQNQDDDMLMMMMEQAYYEAVNDVADFIMSGDVTLEKFEKDLREVFCDLREVFNERSS